MEDSSSGFVQKVYGWMFLGLLASGITALAVASSDAALAAIFGSSLVFYGLIITQLALVFGLSWAARRLPLWAAGAAFLFYCFVTGLTLSAVLLMFTGASVATALFITAGMFGAMAAYGHFTKRDLSGMGMFLFMGLFGIILAGIANFFLRSETLYYIISFAGVAVFAGLAAYDAQKIRRMAGEGGAAILGALALYLDFINLFLMLLRLFGKRRR